MIVSVRKRIRFVDTSSSTSGSTWGKDVVDLLRGYVGEDVLRGYMCERGYVRDKEFC